jgi:hypothetical protein
MVRACTRSLRDGAWNHAEDDPVKLIEAEIAKLSPGGREAWEELELRVHTDPLDQDLPEIMRIFEETGNPPEARTTISFGENGDPPEGEGTIIGPKEDKATIMTLFWLWIGLLLADTAERIERSGEAHKRRELFVIKAVQARDHAEGRQIDRDMTLAQALARLKEGN